MGAKICELIAVVTYTFCWPVVAVYERGIGLPGMWGLMSEFLAGGVRFYARLDLGVDCCLDFRRYGAHLGG